MLYNWRLQRMKTHLEINEAKPKGSQRPYPKGSNADTENLSVSNYTANAFLLVSCVIQEYVAVSATKTLKEV